MCSHVPSRAVSVRFPSEFSARFVDGVKGYYVAALRRVHVRTLDSLPRPADGYNRQSGQCRAPELHRGELGAASWLVRQLERAAALFECLRFRLRHPRRDTLIIHDDAKRLPH